MKSTIENDTLVLALEGRIDVAGSELLGQGGNGSVYRLDDDKIVKVYKPCSWLRSSWTGCFAASLFPTKRRSERFLLRQNSGCKRAVRGKVC